MYRQLVVIFCSIVAVSMNCDEEASPVCRANSSPHICGTICEPSCINPKPKHCPRIVCTKNTEGCRCNDGFLKDPYSGECVPPPLCKTCPPSQAILACGTMCEGTCKAAYQPERCKYIRCLLAGCACDLKDGMVRDESTDTCVSITECPQYGNGTMDLEDYENDIIAWEDYENVQYTF